MNSLTGHCAVSSNNLDARFVKLSAKDVIAQVIFERLYLVSGLSQFAPRGNVPMYPDPHRTIAGYFWILVPFFPKSTLNFLVNTIHQVIWPSPGTISTHHSWPFRAWTRLKGWRSGQKEVAPRQRLFASPPPATSSSKICRACFFASCRCLFPPADLRLHHLFIGSECNCSCIRLTASSRAVVIVMATFCTMCLLAYRCTCPCNKLFCISFTLPRRARGSDRVAPARPGASSPRH